MLPRNMCPVAVVFVSFLATASTCAEDPGQNRSTFAFVKSETTKKHISIESNNDHYRVYFPLEIKDASGQKVFARIRSMESKQGATVNAATSVTFDIAAASELWVISLRAPKSTKIDTVYQVEVGIHDAGQIDPEIARISFSWITRNVKGKIQLTAATAGESIPIQVRTAEIVGGSIKIEYKQVKMVSDGIEYGLVTNAPPIDGLGIRRVSK